MSFDLNYREALWGRRDPRPVIEPLVKQVDLLIGNAEAARAMLGIETHDDPRELARRLTERYGCKRVAVTRRAAADAREQDWSAFLYDVGSGAALESRRHRMHVVDRVGGGDSFAAALIAAVLQDRTDALEFAVAAGALKLSTPGDFSRVSTREIEEFLRACT